MVLWKYWTSIPYIFIIFNEPLDFSFKAIDKQLFSTRLNITRIVNLIDMNED